MTDTPAAAGAEEGTSGQEAYDAAWSAYYGYYYGSGWWGACLKGVVVGPERQSDPRNVAGISDLDPP